MRDDQQVPTGPHVYHSRLDRWIMLVPMALIYVVVGVAISGGRYWEAFGGLCYVAGLTYFVVLRKRWLRMGYEEGCHDMLMLAMHSRTNQMSFDDYITVSLLNAPGTQVSVGPINERGEDS